MKVKMQIFSLQINNYSTSCPFVFRKGDLSKAVSSCFWKLDAAEACLWTEVIILLRIKHLIFRLARVSIEIIIKVLFSPSEMEIKSRPDENSQGGLRVLLHPCSQYELRATCKSYTTVHYEEDLT